VVWLVLVILLLLWLWVEARCCQAVQLPPPLLQPETSAAEHMLPKS
jgi:hypothetical protein